MIAGEAIVTPTMRVPDDAHVHIRFAAALPSISPDGLGLKISFLESVASHTGDVSTSDLNPVIAHPGSSVAGLESCTDRSQSPVTNAQTQTHVIGCTVLPSTDPSKAWRSILFDIRWLAGRTGRLELACDPGFSGDPCADWLAVAELVVSDEDQIAQLLARTHPELRLKNELEHFSHLYLGHAHGAGPSGGKNPAIDTDRGLTAQEESAEDPSITGPNSTDQPDLTTGVQTVSAPTTAYDWALRQLCAQTGITYPDFVSRLKHLAEGRAPLRILTLCCGTARVEAQLQREAGVSAHWTLMDINNDLLEAAKQRFADPTSVTPWVANANCLAPTGQKWDVIMCVAAMHHVVELESFVAFIARSLAPDGEFWSIGEAVGANGNRLWPEARRAANEVFVTLPDRLRRNNLTGKIDDLLPDRDYSVGTFEGIRSADILPLMGRWFDTVDVSQWNCFLWRLLDGAYLPNYHVQSTEDLAHLTRLVNAEIAHYQAGGRGAELHGMFRVKPNIEN